MPPFNLIKNLFSTFQRVYWAGQGRVVLEPQSKCLLEQESSLNWTKICGIKDHQSCDQKHNVCRYFRTWKFIFGGEPGWVSWVRCLSVQSSWEGRWVSRSSPSCGASPSSPPPPSRRAGRWGCKGRWWHQGGPPVAPSQHPAPSSPPRRQWPPPRLLHRLCPTFLQPPSLLLPPWETAPVLEFRLPSPSHSPPLQTLPPHRQPTKLPSPTQTWSAPASSPSSSSPSPSAFSPSLSSWPGSSPRGPRPPSLSSPARRGRTAPLTSWTGASWSTTCRQSSRRPPSCRPARGRRRRRELFPDMDGPLSLGQKCMQIKWPQIRSSDSTYRYFFIALPIPLSVPHITTSRVFAELTHRPTWEWKCVRFTRNSGRGSNLAPKISNGFILNFSLGEVLLTLSFCDFSEMKFWNKCCLRRVPVSRCQNYQTSFRVYVLFFTKYHLKTTITMIWPTTFKYFWGNYIVENIE